MPTLTRPVSSAVFLSACLLVLAAGCVGVVPERLEPRPVPISAYQKANLHGVIVIEAKEVLRLPSLSFWGQTHDFERMKYGQYLEDVLLLSLPQVLDRVGVARIRTQLDRPADLLLTAKISKMAWDTKTGGLDVTIFGKPTVSLTVGGTLRVAGRAENEIATIPAEATGTISVKGDPTAFLSLIPQVTGDVVRRWGEELARLPQLRGGQVAPVAMNAI